MIQTTNIHLVDKINIKRRRLTGPTVNVDTVIVAFIGEDGQEFNVTAFCAGDSSRLIEVQDET